MKLHIILAIITYRSSVLLLSAQSVLLCAHQCCYPLVKINIWLDLAFCLFVRRVQHVLAISLNLFDDLVIDDLPLRLILAFCLLKRSSFFRRGISSPLLLMIQALMDKFIVFAQAQLAVFSWSTAENFAWFSEVKIEKCSFCLTFLYQIRALLLIYLLKFGDLKTGKCTNHELLVFDQNDLR